MTKNSDATADTRHSTNPHGKEITGFVPTQEELIHLVKYWVTKAIHDRYFIFWGQCFGNSDLRCIDLDWQRVDEIAQLLGEEETDKAVKKAYEDIGHEFERDDWIVFRYGTWDEQRAYQVKGGQFLSDFEPAEAEEIACRVVQRVFREGTPEEQLALVRDELTRYARKLYSHNRGGSFVEMFGVSFPSQVRSLIPGQASMLFLIHSQVKLSGPSASSKVRPSLKRSTKLPRKARPLSRR